MKCNCLVEINSIQFNSSSVIYFEQITIIPAFVCNFMVFICSTSTIVTFRQMYQHGQFTDSGEFDKI